MNSPRPNILFVCADQHRGDWQAHKGASFLDTPNLARLAREGVSFDDAVCPSPLCAPARVCLATARNYGRAPTRDRPLRSNADFLPPDVPNVYQRLRAAGYAVGSCGKSDLRKPCLTWGADGRHVVDGVSQWAKLGFTHGADSAGKHDAVKALRDGIAEPYGDFLRRHGLADMHAADYAARPYPNYANVAPTPLPEFAYADNFVGANALALLGSMARAAPWFLQVNFSGPHEPMDVTAAMHERVASRDIPIPSGPIPSGPIPSGPIPSGPIPGRPIPDGAIPDVDPALDRATHLEIRRNYAAMIENIDGWVGQFMRALDSLGALESTVVIYASDHGEMLGEQNEWAKWVPYQPSIAVPLIVWGRGIGHHADRDPASLVDLAPTLIDLAGAEPLARVDGRSLLPRMRQARVDQEEPFRIVGLGRWRAVVARAHVLIVGYRPGMTHGEMLAADWSGTCEMPLLFDRLSDPGQKRNLATERPDVVRLLFDVLERSASGA
jgi:arylsulfatase A-like enzyme